MTANAELNAALAKKAGAEAREIEARIAATEEMRELRLDRGRSFRDAAAAVARKAEAEAAGAEVAAAVMKRQEQEALADWQYQRTYFFTGDVSDPTVRLCIKRLHEWDFADPDCDIEIVFTSYGGDSVWGLVLFDYLQELRAKGHKLTTRTWGIAASMAAILLQAGDVRTMGRESLLIIHQAELEIKGDLGKVIDSTDAAKVLCERIKGIFVKRADGKLSAEEFQKAWDRKNWFVYAEEALEKGLVDEIR